MDFQHSGLACGVVFIPSSTITSFNFHHIMVRYQLPVVVIVFNNGGVYGGDYRNNEEITRPDKDDPAPSSFVADAAHNTLIEAFGEKVILLQLPMNSNMLSLNHLLPKN
ncbi:Oxalyl-CoA decarboxylase protein [Dioscorea alata]|uniref:Oxalyl-CoA decarboxylase protein n=1 Tax=Dioscorea alata TaxID=55571 RepID=A0ACB7VSF0_DIOAL|nr:Oxalyl-CoA decarboxylase protein [Dioscorea alata]